MTRDPQSTPSVVSAELTAARDAAREALRRGDLRGCMDLYDPDLQFKPLEGPPTGRGALEEGMKKLLPFAGTAVIVNRVESVSVDGDRAVEVITQNIIIRGKLWWSKQRVYAGLKSETQWERTATGWKIVGLTVLEEEQVRNPQPDKLTLPHLWLNAREISPAEAPLARGDEPTATG